MSNVKQNLSGYVQVYRGALNKPTHSPKNAALVVLTLLLLLSELYVVKIVKDSKDYSNYSVSAASPDKLEVEEAVLGGNATVVSDPNASGGKYVVFGVNSTPTPTNSPTQIPIPTSPPSSAGAVYGAGIAMDTKSNVRVGPIPRVAASFRASKTGQINSVAWQLREGEGYSLGDCGIARISLQSASSNGQPTGTVLGSLTYDVPCDFNSGILIRNPFPTSSRPSVTAGQMYAVVWENTHNAPSSNYWSVNKNLAWSTTPVTPSDPDHHSWEYTSGSWRADPRHSVGFDVEYAGGGYDGLAYHNTMLNVTSSSVISGNSMLREKITVGGQNRTVNGVFVRVNKQSGSSPLTIGIYEGSTLLRSVSVPYSSIISWDAASVGSGSKGDWEGGSFSPLTLQTGHTYYLRLSTNSDTQYTSIGIFHTQDNTTDASSSPLKTRLNSPAFREGVFERSTNGGSSWSLVYPYTTPGNMQMYFTLQ